jgi:hypothetical protein
VNESVGSVGYFSTSYGIRWKSYSHSIDGTIPTLYLYGWYILYRVKITNENVKNNLIIIYTCSFRDLLSISTLKHGSVINKDS